MSEWGEPDEPAYEQIRRGLRWAPETEVAHDPELRHGANWLRLGVNLLAIAVTWLAAVNVYDGSLAAWKGGAVVVGAAAICWLAEVFA
jgi:hypothetical protein